MAELRAYLPATDATRNYRTLDQYAPGSSTRGRANDGPESIATNHTKV